MSALGFAVGLGSVPRRCRIMNNLITYTGIKSAMHKFERLFDEFEFTRMDEVLKSFE